MCEYLFQFIHSKALYLMKSLRGNKPYKWIINPYENMKVEFPGKAYDSVEKRLQMSWLDWAQTLDLHLVHQL